MRLGSSINLAVMKTIITNISKILHVEQNGQPFKRGSQLGNFPLTENAWLLLENGKIANYGSHNTPMPAAHETIDAQQGMVLPTWVDSHTHLVYAGTREGEFAQRLRGMSYAQIAANGGGILNSAKKLRETSADELYAQAASRLHELIAMGTGALEIKSGYGLTTESELKMLRTARQLAKNFDLPIKTSFLGAHAIPEKFKNDRQAYLRLMIDEMLPAVARENLADYVDVFCEDGYFTVSETEQIIEAAKKYQLRAKLHLNQFTSLGGIQAAVASGALSADHLEVMTDADIQCLAQSNTVGTLLPGCSLFLEIPYAPARALIRENAIVALATDFNPGSAPSGNMNLMVALACIKMKMTPEEAISAATLNGAAALELSHELGSIEKGKRANLIITKPLNSTAFLPYNFGHNHISRVLLNGKTV